ncbi:MAG: hypothetical protein V3U98_03575 [Acidobacteriota bacterium]
MKSAPNLDSEWQRLAAEEERRARRVRCIADLALAVIRQQPSLTPRQARDLVRAARRSILQLFPDSECLYSMLYAPRFERAIAERWPDPDPCAGAQSG